jgi:hypothetical protein
MSPSTGLQVVWQIAALEAGKTGFAEIEPEHFLAGLLQFRDLDAPALTRAGVDPARAAEAATEAAKVSAAIDALAVNGGRLLRTIRRRMGQGVKPSDKSPIHRSPASRQCFEKAAEFAQKNAVETITTVDVLKALVEGEAPLPDEIAGPLRAAAARPAEQSQLLQEHGRLVRGDGEAARDKAHRIVAKALLQALGEKNCRCALLVSDDDLLCKEVAAAVADLLEKSPAAGTLSGSSLFDLGTLPRPDFDRAGKSGAHRAWEQLFAEATRTGSLLLLPPIGEHDRRWAGYLGSCLTGSRSRWLVRVSPAAFDQWMAKDRHWSRLARPVRPPDDLKSRIPSEL